MSMNAVFVQVEPEALAKILANPDLAEPLFHEGPAIPPQFAKLSGVLEQRMRAAGPQMMATVLSSMDPRVRQRLEERLGHSTESLAAGAGANELIKLMQDRARRATERPNLGSGEPLNLDKDWHGVHYMLCGQTEPGRSLLSQAVMGGVDLGDDDEGFSGYGPARAFTVKQVAEISRALSNPALEAEAAARFDAQRMTKLDIYPGFEPSDRDALLDALRRLREFYADAAGKGNGIVTCLV